MMNDRFVTTRGARIYDNHMDSWTTRDVFELAIQLVLVAVFVWAVVMIVRYLVKYLSSQASAQQTDPLVIAKRRLASGEITSKEFEELKKDLK